MDSRYIDITTALRVQFGVHWELWELLRLFDWGGAHLLVNTFAERIDNVVNGTLLDNSLVCLIQIDRYLLTSEQLRIINTLNYVRAERHQEHYLTMQRKKCLFGQKFGKKAKINRLTISLRVRWISDNWFHGSDGIGRPVWRTGPNRLCDSIWLEMK